MSKISNIYTAIPDNELSEISKCLDVDVSVVNKCYQAYMADNISFRFDDCNVVVESSLAEHKIDFVKNNATSDTLKVKLINEVEMYIQNLHDFFENFCTVHRMLPR